LLIFLKEISARLFKKGNEKTHLKSEIFKVNYHISQVGSLCGPQLYEWKKTTLRGPSHLFRCNGVATAERWWLYHYISEFHRLIFALIGLPFSKHMDIKSPTLSLSKIEKHYLTIILIRNIFWNTISFL